MKMGIRVSDSLLIADGFLFVGGSSLSRVPSLADG